MLPEQLIFSSTAAENRQNCIITTCTFLLSPYSHIIAVRPCPHTSVGSDRDAVVDIFL